MVIIEGPEGSGKTTLARYLQNEVPLNYFHFGGPPKRSEHDARLTKSQGLLEVPIIQDRSPWISDPIYTALKGDEDTYSLWGAYVHGLKVVKARVIYCRPLDEAIFSSMLRIEKPYKSRQYERLILENKERLLYLYDMFMEMLNPWCFYDWSLESSDLVLKRIVRVLRAEREKRNQSATKQLPDSQNQEGRNNTG